MRRVSREESKRREEEGHGATLHLDLSGGECTSEGGNDQIFSGVGNPAFVLGGVGLPFPPEAQQPHLQIAGKKERGKILGDGERGGIEAKGGQWGPMGG